MKKSASPELQRSCRPWRRSLSAALSAAFALSLLPVGAPATPVASAQNDRQFLDAPRRLLVGGNVGPLALGDLDGDGDLDMVRGSSLLENDGQASFRDPASSRRYTYPSPGAPTDLAIGDITGDGWLDVVIGGSLAGPSGITGVIWVLPNDGTGSFPAAREVARFGKDSGKLALGDLDGNGLLDIVTSGGGGRYYLNQSDGSYRAAGPLYGGDVALVDLAVGLFNDDNVLDLVLAGAFDNSQSPTRQAAPATVFFGDGGGGFGRGPVLNPGGNDTVAIKVGDLSGDGRPEIVLQNRRIVPTSPAIPADAGFTQIYLNEGGTFTAGPTLDPDGAATDLDLGDLDGDGLLDVVVATSNTPPNSRSEGPRDQSQVFLNRGGTTFAPGEQVNPEGGSTQFITLADVTGDGALDALLDNFDGVYAYVNSRKLDYQPVLMRGADLADPRSSGPTFRAFEQTRSADLTGDGRLDLAVESGGALFYLPHESLFGEPNQSLAMNLIAEGARAFELGDFTGDGALDLITASQGATLQLYANNGAGAFSLSGSVPLAAAADALAVGDFVGDGPLDVAAVVDGTLRLFSNRTGSFSAGPALTVVPGVRAMAVGDVDDDGALDVVLQYPRGAQVYRNNRLGGFTSYDNVAAPNNALVLDVALANLSSGSGPELILLTTTGILTYARDEFANRRGYQLQANLPNTGQVSSLSLAVGDFSGDGAPDLALLSALAVADSLFEEVVLLLNDGQGAFSRLKAIDFGQQAVARDEPQPRRITLGDFVGDSRPEMMLETSGTLVALGQATTQGVIFDNPPTVRVGTPGQTAAAAGYVSPTIFDGPEVAIPFTLFDAEGDPVSRVRGEYSRDGGLTWRLALPASIASISNLAASPEGSPHTFRWRSFNDRPFADDPFRFSGLFGKSDDVRFRITALSMPQPRPRPSDSSAWRPSVAGSFQHAAWRATSGSFRARGTIARVVSAANPAGEPGALVYLLRGAPSGGPSGKPLTRGGLFGEDLTSDALGYVASAEYIGPGDRLVAVLPISTTGKLTYAVTSAAPDSADLAIAPVTTATLGVQTLVVSQRNPLLLLNLSVSLEWEASSDRAYLDQLQANLLRTSQLLYDWSNGQIALGNVTIGSGKLGWETADIQIFASNGVRPNATQGGIVSSPITATFTVDGSPRQVVFEPGHIRMGATWRSDGVAGAVSGEDWARALAHEIGHYAFFLDETYLGRSDNLLEPIDGCDSPMADPYIESGSEFRPRGDWTGPCLATLQHRTSGLSEWELIGRFYDRPALAPGWDFRFQQPATQNENPGPAALPLQITTFREFLFNGEGLLSEFTASYRVLPPGGRRYEPSAAAQVVLYQRRPFEGGRIYSVLDLGAPAIDQILARGIAPDDSLCFFDPVNEFAGCGIEQGQLRLRSLPGWRPELAITPRVTAPGSNTMSILLEVPAASVAPPTATLPLSLSVQLFPREVIGEAFLGQPTSTLVLQGSGPAAVYRGSFENLAALVEEGLLRVWVDDGSGRESVADFAIGGNPAPKKKPPRRSRRRAPAVSPDGQATLFSEDAALLEGQFYALQRVSSLPEPPAWATVIGQGYRLIASSDALLATPSSPLALSLSYAEGAVPPGLEGNVRAIFNDGTGWRELPTRLNTGRNEAAVTVEPTQGIYVLVTSLRLRLARDGWNLIFAYPGGDQELPEALASAGAGYSLVYGFDESDPDEPWRVFAPGLPAQWQPVVNDLGALASGESYWIYATRAITVPLRAVDDRQPLTAAQRATTLATGSVLDQPPATYYGALPDVPPSAPLTVEARVGDALCGSTLTSPHTIDGQLQAAFSLKVTSATPDAPACGRQGELVTLELRQGDTVLNTASVRWDNTRASQVRFGQTTPFGLVFLPFTALRARGGVAEGPDLRVAGIEVVPAAPTAGQPAELRITITNQGSAAVARSFWVDLYVDPDEPPAGGQPWTALSEFGVSWRIYRLEPGETLVLSSLRPDDPLNPGQSYSNFKGFGAATTYRLYAQVDSYGVDGDPEGVIPEEDEANNVFGPLSVRVRP